MKKLKKLCYKLGDIVYEIGTIFKKKSEPHHHFYLEIGLTDTCDYGCKVVKCERCDDVQISHRRIYGCPLG